MSAVCTSATSNRKGFKFWLNLAEQADSDLIALIEGLKDKRQFTQAIRDGIALIQDLRQGKIDVLRLLFPWVWEMIALEVQATQPAPISNRLTTFKASQGEDAIAKLLDGQITASKGNSDEKPSYNLVLSMLGLGQHVEDLPPDVVEYGIRKGKLSKQQVKQWEKANKPLPLPATNNTLAENEETPKGPKAMDVPQFEAPEFGDLDLDGMLTCN